jgi:predicted esterase
MCFLLALLVVLGSTVVAPASSVQRPSLPDLKVSKGHFKLVGSTLTGSFSIKDKGAVAVGRTTASLSVHFAGEDHVIKRFRIEAIRAGRSRRVMMSVAQPKGLPLGSWPVKACADRSHKVTERIERNNCRVLGDLVGSVPTEPITYPTNTPFEHSDARSSYWAFVPTSYDASHSTPMTLFVWLHGCGNRSSEDISTVSPGGDAQDWISLALLGAEGACWDVSSDPARVLAAIADIKTHFNINPRRVIIGGFSSGGDLAYRTAYYHADTFAGLLAENTSPFRDTGCPSWSACLAAASWRFNVVHLAHLEDEAYPIATVRAETDALTSDGFPVQRIEVEGGHYDGPGAVRNGQQVPGTFADLRTYLLPHLDDGWLSPG